MGYAFIMFGLLLIVSVVTITAVTYGVAKESQIAPLKAENIYADREAGKAQTRLTIINTCLSGSSTYNGANSGNGPHTLYLTVKDNGSTVLNPNNSTIFYNSSYFPFTVTSGKVWTPLKNSSMSGGNIYIYSSDANYPLRLMMATSNGITTVAPTTPTNFSGRSISSNTSYSFNWSSSTDDTGIAYYLLYSSTSRPISCPPDITYTFISRIPGNSTGSSVGYDLACQNPPCQHSYFFITAVDTEGNMGIQSVTLDCNPPTTGKDCKKNI